MKSTARGLPRNLAVLGVVAWALLVSACHEDPHLQGEPVNLQAGTHSVALQLGDCAVYRVTKTFFSSKIEESLSPEFYLGFTTCISQSLNVEGGFAVASLCRQAIGAGGGCARGGTYRTADGVQWEKQSGSGAWVALPAGG